MTAGFGRRSITQPMGVAVVDDSSRRCALPGCDVVIEIIPGRPERRYCTAAHRSAARQARRASAQSEGDARLADALPWLREPEAPVVHAGTPAPTASPAGPPPRVRRRGVPRLRSRRPNEPLPRRRRALAVLGAAGLLVGGYSITASEPTAPAEAPVQAAPGETTEEQWAARAQVALSSLNRQLDTIAQTEETWSRVPESRRAGSPPAPVSALRERRNLLERQRATLQSQLAAYRSLEQTADELRLSEQYLSAIEKALADLPPEGRRSPEQAAAIAALDEQRDLRIRQRDAKREELRSLSDGMQSARRTALPDDTQRTTQVSNEVLALSKDPRRGGTPTEPTTSRRPDAVGGRDEDDTRPRAEVGTSGPPDPRGPRDETREQRRGSDAGSGERKGAVGTVVGAVGDVVSGDVVSGGDRAGDRAGRKAGSRAGGEKAARPAPTAGGRGDRTGGKAADKPAPEPAGGPVTEAVGTVTGPVTDALPGGGRSSEGPTAASDSGSGNRGSGGSPAGGGVASGSRGGAAEQNPRPAPAEASPSARSAGTPAPRSSSSGGIASSVAGPIVRAMTPGWAAPYAEAGLQQADREAAARMAGSGSGSSNPTPVARSGSASSSSSVPQQGSSSGNSTSSPVQRGTDTGGTTAESGSSSSAGAANSGSPSREVVTTSSSS